MPVDSANIAAAILDPAKSLESTHLATPETFAAFIEAWQTGTLPKSDWTHAAHIAVGAYFLTTHPADALTHLRAGIRRYNEAVGTANTETSGYHETLTRLWHELILRTLPANLDAHAAAILVVRELGPQRDLHRAYYSYDVVKSIEARHTWHAPDLIGPYGKIL